MRASEAAQGPLFAPDAMLAAQSLLLDAGVLLSSYSGAPRQLTYVEELARRIESTPGVLAAGVAKTNLYLLQSDGPAPPPPVDRFQESLVSTGYFGAIGMRLVRGRWVTGPGLAA